MENLPRLLEIFFFNNIDVKIVINPLLNDFRSGNIIFSFFLVLAMMIESVQYLSTIFQTSIFEHYLCKISLLGPVFIFVKLLFITFLVIIFVHHCAMVI